MIDDLDGLDLATGEFGRLLDGVSAEHLALSTPCPEWDVRYLVAHVVGGNRFASLVLDGVPSSAAVERIMSTSHLSDRPARDFALSADEQRRRFRSPGVLEGVVDHPLGVIGARRFLRFRIFDCTLHAWDLATAIGADATLDPDLVDALLQIVRAEPAGMGFGVEATASVGGSLQQQLLALSGRA